MVMILILCILIFMFIIIEVSRLEVLIVFRIKKHIDEGNEDCLSFSYKLGNSIFDYFWCRKEFS